MSQLIPRSFGQTVDALRFGTLADELTTKLQDLVAKCATTGRAGAITLTLTLKPGNGGQIEVADDIKVKLPKEQKGTSLMFATPDNFLQRNDPRQPDLPGIRQVQEPDTGPVRKVGAAA